MPMKTCPDCKKQSGPRTKQCECGHNFASAIAPVAAASSTMTKSASSAIDATLLIKDTISVTKTIIQQVETRRSLSVPEPWEDDVDDLKPDLVSSKPEATGKVALKGMTGFLGQGRTYTPAGEPPFKPEGYKSGWKNGDASPEVIQNWAVRVYNSGNYHPHAILYWARFFWEMNDVSELPDGTFVYGKGWRRIRDLIMKALTPTGSNQEFVDKDDY